MGADISESTEVLENMNDNLNDKIVEVSSFKRRKKQKKQILVNDIIKEMVLLHKNTDESLKELTRICMNDKENE